jgi:tetratricopeptide (TPR) repeat protein
MTSNNRFERSKLKIANAVIAMSAVILSSCAGVGIVASSDPLVKLNDAEYLFMHENRPVPAESLILEAMAIYRKRDDPHGLGNANREYGDFLRSEAVTNWQRAYSRNGFFDHSVTYENRLERASEHYTKALEYYRVAETRELAAGEYDHLTNVYFNMGLSHWALGESAQACGAYDRALHSFEANMRRNPAAQPQGSKVGNVPQTIAAAKKRVGCGEGV